MKYALVQFKDGKRQVQYLVLSKDIKGFQPSCAEDIPNKEFMVKWQDSFDDTVAGVHDDGRFPAKILLVGATPEEVKAKADELRIRLPSRFPIADSTHDFKPMEKPLRKQRKKQQTEEPEQMVRKKRMLDTSKCIDSSSSSSLKFQESQSASKGSPFKVRLSSSPSSDKPQKSQSGSISSPFKVSLLSSPSSDKPQKSQSGSISSPFKVSLLSSPSSAKPQKSQSGSKGSPFKVSLLSSPSSDKPQRSQSASKVPVEQMPGTELTCELPIKPQSVSCPVKIDDVSSLSDFVATSDDEDDATVLLDKLQKEHQFCSQNLAKLKKKNKKLEVELNFCKMDMKRQTETMKTFEKQIDDLRAENMALKLAGSSSGMCATSSSPTQFEWNSPSPFSEDQLDSSGAFLHSATSHNEGSVVPECTGQNKSKPSISRKLFKEDEEEEVKRKAPQKDISSADGFDEGLDGVSQRIKADLLGKRILTSNGKQVHVGMGVNINKNAWLRSISTKTDDSKFLKDCASAIWGREALMKRTGQRSTSGKKPCTPKKVNVLYAMLRGKMEARGESKQQQEFILENLAPKWLTDKCYDTSRKQKISTQAPGNSC